LCVADVVEFSLLLFSSSHECMPTHNGVSTLVGLLWVRGDGMMH